MTYQSFWSLHAKLKEPIEVAVQSVRVLVGNVSDMSACVATTLTLLAKNWLMSNVANAVTGFRTGSCVG